LTYCCPKGWVLLHALDAIIAATNYSNKN